ncbi:B3/B4 domain-containing protein [[Clostridium] dakarense]|uniref:B3/B4 domain-containing protein n=1 Tax=Faecalimicrobium dakarense TaxID=1301100 RepID=UPI0004B25715|nr:phenylalanine--tRNA ligase beta subunit-related protein [[Clostridium] dakarense]
MIEIKISDKLKEKCPKVAIGCIEANVDVYDGCDKLWKLIDNKCSTIKETITQSDILKIKNIEASRKAYKSLGKDPSRYRLSSESLVKRVVKDMGLYKVNNVVDINNLISLKSFCSVGTYDLDKVSGVICFNVGGKEERYDGIGRGSINIENLPVFEDEKGKFGSTTSDSVRAMITKDTKHILMNIISFNEDEELNDYIDYGIELLKKYSNATILDSKIIK